MKKVIKKATAKRRGGVPAFTKRELVNQISRGTSYTFETVYGVVQASLSAIMDAVVSGRAVEFRDFGVLEPVLRKARVGRNPRKPEDVVDIPKRWTVKFRPGNEFRARLEKKKK